MFTTKAYKLLDGYLIADRNLNVNQDAIICGQRTFSAPYWSKLSKFNSSDDIINCSTIHVRLSQVFVINVIEFKLSGNDRVFEYICQVRLFGPTGEDEVDVTDTDGHHVCRFD